MQLYLDGPRDKYFTFFNSSSNRRNLKISLTMLPNDINFLKNKKLKFLINAQSNAVKKIFNIKKIPFRQIDLSKKSEEELGLIFTFFVLETILLARLMKINPFNQPAVEQIKVETKKILT
jgi:glucose-6-phosphate isomerase